MNAPDVVARLRELDERSGGKREAWRAEWRDERERFVAWLREHVPGVDVTRDPAGNIWARRAGASPETVIIGSHMDCVPDGGWLDGCLGLLAAAEVLRSLESPQRSVALVDWADEEGSRFGHSLLGSSAAAGLLDVAAASELRDADGVRLADALADNGVVVADMPGAAAELDGAVAYVELHIEQGPVLDEEETAACAVDGCLGVRRTEFVFIGRAGHAGATPMDRRQDPLLAAAAFVLAARALAVEAGGLLTVGVLRTEPSTPTAIAERVRLIIDLRHRDLEALDGINSALKENAKGCGASESVAVHSESVWSIDPIRFDPALVERATRLTGGRAPLTSGPLHDAAAMARAGVPSVMVFVRTLGGTSHSRKEDARDEDLVAAIEAFSAVVTELVS